MTVHQLCVRQVAKAGLSLEACEDAYALPEIKCGGLPPAFRVGLADGATTSSGARHWAEILSKAVQSSLVPPTRLRHFLPRLEVLRQVWRQSAEMALPADRAWYAQVALERGAFATFLRLQVSPNEWEAQAMGDSCMFHLRAGGCLRSFPLTEPEAFEAAPDLLCSAPGHDRNLGNRLQIASGRLRPGDRLLLATDALACWLLKTRRWEEPLNRLNDFEAWVQEERDAGRMKNDDTTLITFRIP